jgi:hypothetical protein
MVDLGEISVHWSSVRSSSRPRWEQVEVKPFQAHFLTMRACRRGSPATFESTVVSAKREIVESIMEHLV